MDRRTSAEVMDQLLPLSGATVIDVGCGDGWLTRQLTKKGAHVTGIEVSPKQLAHAQAVPHVGDEHYMQGIAEDLPTPSQSADIVIFFNSLHHVDKAGLFKALREAARVLKPGGLLFISEPLAEGDYFEVMKPVHDETAVRRNAQEALRYGPEFGLLQEKAFTYIDTVKLKDFQAFHDRLTMINPHVRERFDDKEDEIRELFESHGRKTEDGWLFDQPMRAHLMRRS
jgi:ubiquinone/menaquinone biosynthesis C-methylase UbiE